MSQQQQDTNVKPCSNGCGQTIKWGTFKGRPTTFDVDQYGNVVKTVQGYDQFHKCPNYKPKTQITTSVNKQGQIVQAVEKIQQQQPQQPESQPDLNTIMLQQLLAGQTQIMQMLKQSEEIQKHSQGQIIEMFEKSLVHAEEINKALAILLPKEFKTAREIQDVEKEEKEKEAGGEYSY